MRGDVDKDDLQDTETLVQLTMKYCSGNLLVSLTEAKGVKAIDGKVYAKSHLLPDTFGSSKMTESQEGLKAYLKREDVNTSSCLKFATIMSVSCNRSMLYILRLLSKNAFISMVLFMKC